VSIILLRNDISTFHVNIEKCVIPSLKDQITFVFNKYLIISLRTFWSFQFIFSVKTSHGNITLLPYLILSYLILSCCKQIYNGLSQTI
jgi:hypothetical protein